MKENCNKGHKIGIGNRCERCGVVPNCCSCGQTVNRDTDICEHCMDWLCEKCTHHVVDSECDYCPACAEYISDMQEKDE